MALKLIETAYVFVSVRTMTDEWKNIKTQWKKKKNFYIQYFKEWSTSMIDRKKDRNDENGIID